MRDIQRLNREEAQAFARAIQGFKGRGFTDEQILHFVRNQLDPKRGVVIHGSLGRGHKAPAKPTS